MLGSVSEGVDPALATVLQTQLLERDGRIPASFGTDHGVEDGEELPHAGDLGDFGLLAVGA